MISRRQWFSVLLTFLASVAVLMVILPLAVTVLATGPGELRSVIADNEVIKSIGTSFLAGIIATLLGFIFGVPLAWVLARWNFTGKAFIEGLVALPVIIPHTAAGIALLMVFGSRGMLGSLFAKAGLFFVDSIGGIVAAMVFVGLPFLISASREAFTGVDPELEKAAMIDGANMGQVFTHVTLPQSWRGVTSGAMMMWARGISEFGAVAILAYHPKTVPVLVFERFQGYGLNAARPIAVILILVILVVFVSLRLLANRNREQ